VKFKAVSEAYETLYDEDKRAAYDRYGPSDGPQGMGGMGPGDVDIDDLLSHMFGMGFEGPPPGARGPPRKRKGQDVTQSYDITLEDLYKGKTVKFSSTRDILCKTCKGVGGKDKSKERECVACKGKGWNTTLRSVGGGMVVQDRHPCGSCDQTGKVFREKDRCKKCKGKKVQEEKKVLELYIPRGSQYVYSPHFLTRSRC
jgi:DnaJ homolog subfamily A member 2